MSVVIGNAQDGVAKINGGFQGAGNVLSIRGGAYSVWFVRASSSYLSYIQIRNRAGAAILAQSAETYVGGVDLTITAQGTKITIANTTTGVTISATDSSGLVKGDWVLNTGTLVSFTSLDPVVTGLPVYIGNQQVQKLYFGNQEVVHLYKGTTEIF